MRPPAILYLVGMLLLLIGERLIGGEDMKRWAFDGASLISLTLALALLVQARNKADDEQKPAHGTALTWAGVGMFSVVLYALTTD